MQPNLPPSADEQQAIGQFLALAESANVHFELIGERVVIRAVNPNWMAWSTLRRYLDEIGLPRLEAYFKQTSDAERQRLAATA
ncbi:MAG TPA: hypothetical protein VFE52_11835 [Devosia sp.]|jgi:hypothetical protein|nr:hypothetical protein [Devosia sp.]